MRRSALVPMLSIFVCGAVIASAAAVRPLWSSDAAALGAGLLYNPKTALETVCELESSGAVPTAAQAEDGGQPSFTALPETAAQEPASQPDSQAAAPSGDSASSEAAPAAPEPIPEGMAALEAVHYEQGSGGQYIAAGAGSIKNCTSLSAAEIDAEVGQALPFQIEVGSSEPQVLIMHTHATETYELEDKSWCDPAFSARSTDTSVNMVAVGERIAAELNAAGITTLHDETLHDYPSYNGSYEKSNATVRSYLEQYPSIKVVLDVHRDAIQREDGTRIKPVAKINGQTAAQVMIICGADNGGNLPNFRQNLRFAARWEAKMEEMYPGLTRPVLFDYRYYNQDLTTGSLLIEMGGHANTLDEALYSGELVGKALAVLFTEG